MKPSRRKLSLLFSWPPSIKANKTALGNSSHAVAAGAADAAPNAHFLMLPSEIRNHIYNYLFQGSVATYRAAKKIGIHKYRRYIVTSSSSTHMINLVCKQCYQECHQLFYSETVIDLSQLPNPYYNVPSFLRSPPRYIGSYATQLEGIPLHSIISSGLETFLSLKTVVLVLPRCVITHTLPTRTSTPIMEMEDDDVYQRLKLQPDWGAKQNNFRHVVDTYPNIVFKSSMDVICYENREYVPDSSYDSFKMPCQYDPYSYKLIIFKDQITKLLPRGSIVLPRESTLTVYL